MKEDILEQLCEEYFHLKGYLTVSNVKFRPDKNVPGYDVRKDCVHNGRAVFENLDSVL